MTMLFPEPEGELTAVDAKGETKTTRGDLLSYEKYLDGVQVKTDEARKLGKGFEARLVVPTGEPVVTRAGKQTGRGMIESKHERMFKTVGNMRQQRVTVIPEKLPDNETLLRISLGAKREFTDLTNARRDRGRINYQAGQAQEKATAAKEAGDRKAPALQKKADQLKAEVASLDTEIVELEKIVAAYAEKIGKDVEDLTTDDMFKAFAQNGDTPEPAKAVPAKATAAVKK